MTPDKDVALHCIEQFAAHSLLLFQDNRLSFCAVFVQARQAIMLIELRP